MQEQLIKDTSHRMDQAVDTVKKELTAIRTGRASLSILDRVTVSAYGSDMPINQVATLATPEASLITVKPFDQTLLPAIEKAILKADLGITPANDGKIIRLPVPPLTEERRKQLAKKVNETVEHGKVAVRNVRRDARQHAEKAEKDGLIGQDDGRKTLERIEQLTKDHEKVLDKLGEGKTQEIMTV